MQYLIYFLLLGRCLCYSKFELRVGNPDDTAKIERPCTVYDQNCIRKFFSDHGHCTIKYGPAPDPLIRAQDNLYLPRINVTSQQIDVTIQGINGRIEEFYINRDTKNLVIAVEFRNINFTTNLNYFEFHRRAKEPVVTVTPGMYLYESVVVTAIIPKIDDLQLDQAECEAYSNTAFPRVIMSPTAYQSSDPEVQLSAAELYTDLPLNVRELTLTESYFFLATFIQYNICDFGLNVV